MRAWSSDCCRNSRTSLSNIRFEELTPAHPFPIFGNTRYWVDIGGASHGAACQHQASEEYGCCCS